MQLTIEVEKVYPRKTIGSTVERLFEGKCFQNDEFFGFDRKDGFKSSLCRGKEGAWRCPVAVR